MINLGIMKNTPIIIGDLHNPRIQNLHEPSGFKVQKSMGDGKPPKWRNNDGLNGRRSD